MFGTTCDVDLARSSGTNRTKFGYDALDRLTSATYPAALGLPASESFSYDDAGNRESPGDPNDYAYDANNRITASPGKVWVYDGDGNPVSVNAGVASEKTFAHDAEGRMGGYTSAATSASAAYLYDPFGRRMKKNVNGTTTWFIWDGDQLLAEFDSSGDRERRYTYTVGFAVAEQVIGVPNGDVAQAVHSDHLDTPRSLSDDAASTIWRGVYRAFGETVVDEDPDGDLTNIRLSARFPGQFEDAESSMYYNRHRYYEPRIGRYLGADRIGQAGGLNVFIYARNAPTARIDPVGLFDEDVDHPNVPDIYFSPPLPGGTWQPHVECDNGNPVVVIPDPWKYAKEGLFLRCGIVDCWTYHELTHRRQLNSLTPYPCRGAPPPDSGGHGYEPTYRDRRRHQEAEAEAFEREIECLNKLQPCDDDCKKEIAAELQSAERGRDKARAGTYGDDQYE